MTEPVRERGYKCPTCEEILFCTPEEAERHFNTPIDTPLEKGFVFGSSVFIHNFNIIFDEGTPISGKKDNERREAYGVHTHSHKRILYSDVSKEHLLMRNVNSGYVRKNLEMHFLENKNPTKKYCILTPERFEEFVRELPQDLKERLGIERFERLPKQEPSIRILMDTGPIETAYVKSLGIEHLV